MELRTLKQLKDSLLKETPKIQSRDRNSLYDSVKLSTLSNKALEVKSPIKQERYNSTGMSKRARLERTTATK